MGTYVRTRFFWDTLYKISPLSNAFSMINISPMSCSLPDVSLRVGVQMYFLTLKIIMLQFNIDMDDQINCFAPLYRCPSGHHTCPARPFLSDKNDVMILPFVIKIFSLTVKY